MIRKISLLFAGALMGASAMSLVYGTPGSAANAAGSETYKQLAIFGDIFERVRAQYVTPPDDKSLVVKLDEIAIWRADKPDDESAQMELRGGADDRVFRLDRVSNEICAPLLKEEALAALRRD